MLKDRLQLFIDDKGVMLNISMINGVVHLYVIHKVSELEIINMIEGVGLEEGGQFVVDDEGQKELEGDVEGEKELDEEDEQVMLMAKKSYIRRMCMRVMLKLKKN